MSEIEQRILRGDTHLVSGTVLANFVSRQRWFGGKSREVKGASMLSAVPLRTSSPYLVLALVEMRFQPESAELYQLFLGFRPDQDGWDAEVICRGEGWTAYDALSDPALARELLRLMRNRCTFQRADAVVEFGLLGGLPPETTIAADVRPLDRQQSNSSVVFDNQLILKLYRRLEPGLNPELELLRFLTDRGFEGIARLDGWYSYSGRPTETTLGILQDYLPAASDGWTAALASLAGGSADDFIGTVRGLGHLTGQMHVALASDPVDPNFAPEEPSGEALSALARGIEEEIERVFLRLPTTDAVASIAGRAEEVREQLRQLPEVGAAGRVIRHHGDYHLGQVLWTGQDWVVLDFEGEPVRSLAERRQKRSPLRDVAGMLRSFAYAASAAALTAGVQPPEGWEQDVRDEFLAGYLPTVEPHRLLPPSHELTERLLSIFELEKAVYELRYELDNRPDWVEIPVAGILRLLGASKQPSPSGRS